MKVKDIYLENILLDKKLFQNILVYNSLYKKLRMKPLRICFDKLYGISKIYNGIRYFELSNSYKEFYHKINSRICCNF